MAHSNDYFFCQKITLQVDAQCILSVSVSLVEPTGELAGDAFYGRGSTPKDTYWDEDEKMGKRPRQRHDTNVELGEMKAYENKRRKQDKVQRMIPIV